MRPHWLDVPLDMLGFAALVVGIAAALWVLAGFGTVLASRFGIVVLAATLLGLRYLWGEIARRCRRHIVTRDRLVVTGGVIRRYRIEIPLARVQHTVVVRRARDRFAGLGSIGFATAGTGGVEAAILGVPDVDAVHGRITEVLNGRGG
ncbi:MAG: PH domain-containing protein [Phycisphaerales bacterium]